MATILIVDDHVLNRQFLVALLGFDQHELLVAADGIEALALARARRPALIITDILMPNMNGYDFITQMRAEPSIADTPVIFYTSTYSMREAGVMADNCGVRWVLQKPATPELILQTVREALGLPLMPTPADAKPAPDRLAAIDGQFSAYLEQLEASCQLMSTLLSGVGRSGSEREPVRRIVQQQSQSLSDLQNLGLRLSALIGMGIEMSIERDPLRLLETGCRVARHISVARYAVIGIIDDAGERLAHLALRGLEPAVRDRLASLAPRSGVLGSLLDSRAAQRRSHLDGDPEVLGLPASHPPVHSFLGVPIASPGRSYGWLYLVDKLGADQFSELDERAVATVANQLAVAYENLALYEALQRQITQWRADVSAQVLHDSAAADRRAQQIAGVAHVTTAPDGVFQSWSATLPQLLGTAPGALPASLRDWLGMVEPADRVRVRSACFAAVRAGCPVDIDYHIRRGDGTLMHVRHVAEPVAGTAGRACWFSILQDLTGQQQ